MNKIIIILIAIIFCVALFLTFFYSAYQYEVKDCCDGYRTHVLSGQEGGECGYWSFIDHLQNMKGCRVEEYASSQEEVTT